MRGLRRAQRCDPVGRTRGERGMKQSFRVLKAQIRLYRIAQV